MLDIKDILGAEALKSEHEGEHSPDCNRIAALAEGRLSGEEKEQAIHHLVNCSECNRLFMETVKELELDEVKNRSRSFWQNRTPLALAASLILCLLVGVVTWHSGFFPGSSPEQQIMTASVAMDEDLEIALALGEDGWSDAEVDNMAAMLLVRGVNIAAADTREVVLDQSMMVQQKGMFRKKEELHIRVENGVMYLKVVEVPEK